MQGHGHGSHDATSPRELKIAASVTGAYFIFEMGIGLYTGSVAVIVDALHTFSAVAGVVLALIAQRIGTRPAEPTRTFGSARAEVLGALLNGGALLMMALVALVMGYMRLREPIDLPPGPMLLAAGVGIVAEGFLLWLMFRGQKENLNMRGAYWHVVQTYVGSFIIIVAAGVIHYTGFMRIDPILGMLFGLIILYAAWGIIRDAVVILMEGTPPGIDLNEICERILRVDGVENIHHVHAWTLTSNKHVFSAHLKLPEGAGPESQDRILREVQSLLRSQYGFYFSTMQLETRALDESGAEDLDITTQS